MIYSDEVRDALLKKTESYRRERPTMDAIPVVDPTVRDYAAAGTMIQQAMHHLDESIPTGQRLRTELAADLLVAGTYDLTEWLRAKGYDSSMLPLLNIGASDAERAAVDTLTRLGYTYLEGAELWKPPLGTDVLDDGEPTAGYVDQDRQLPLVEPELPLERREQTTVPGLVPRTIRATANALLRLVSPQPSPTYKEIMDAASRAAACERRRQDSDCVSRADCIHAWSHLSAVARRLTGTAIPQTAPDSCYVVGFAFTKDRSRVLLINKTSGLPHLVGKWNGLGGRIKTYEGIDEAMSREFHEESGLYVPAERWRLVAPVQFDGQRGGYILTTTLEPEALAQAVSSEEGLVDLHDTQVICASSNAMPNLMWMIGMCLDPERPRFYGADYSAARDTANRSLT